MGNRFFIAAAILAACSDGKSPGTPDAPPMVDAPPDSAPMYPACAEFVAGGGNSIPAHVMGSIAGAQLASPQNCASIDAPFGIETAGSDAVVRIDGLAVGETYVVKLTSNSDLSFYVATGCGTAMGPSAAQCELFVDATQAGELGTFVAEATTEYIVVDYYSASPPDDPTFTLDVYHKACDSVAGCQTGAPVCLDYRCVQCASEFDCTNAQQARCDTATNQCVAGFDQCLSDDGNEPDNDGPAGASLLAANTSTGGQICSAPSYKLESDFFEFDVTTTGETWTIQVDWPTARDLDLHVFDADGKTLGFSLWENPERVRLTYLPPGRYYARVRDYATSANATAQSFTISAFHSNGPGCTSADDCATEFRNQIFRGDCVAGSCVALEGSGATPEYSRCDSQSDCAAGLHCPSFFFVADADTRETCNRECSSDVQCDAGYVCTTYAQTNFCVPKCTSTSQCPTAINNAPSSGPWARLTCEASTGRCLP